MPFCNLFMGRRSYSAAMSKQVILQWERHFRPVNQSVRDLVHYNGTWYGCMYVCDDWWNSLHTDIHTCIRFLYCGKDSQKDTYIFREPEKSPRKKKRPRTFGPGTKMSPQVSLTTHKLSNVHVVACAVEQEQCSLPRTGLKLTETCIPRTLKTAVQIDSSKDRKKVLARKNVLASLVQGTKMSPQVRSHKHTHAHTHDC